MRLHDTATGEIRELAQREPGIVSIYLCGPTVYGPPARRPRPGHGRLRHPPPLPRVERRPRAPRLQRHRHRRQDHRTGPARVEDPADIAHRCEAVWWQAMDALNVARPTDDPHATAWVDEMVALIGALVAAGHAYVTDDGVYLDVATVPGYGLLADQSLADLRAGGGDRTWSAPSTSVTRPTSPSGSWPSPTSRRGPRPGATAARAGTPSASSCRSPSSARASTCTAAAST